jgi:anti-sigma regulatory factor (Ser/Thr protein kinase)
MLPASMTQPDPDTVRTRLELTSTLADLRLVAPWVAEMTSAYGFSADLRFAIELCLEEALSNIVRHGYAGEAGHALRVDFVRGDSKVFFVVEDHAPAFEPLRPGEAAPADLNTITPGGQGLRLIYRFANSVKYERLKEGNRLTLEFVSKAGN